MRVVEGQAAIDYLGEIKSVFADHYERFSSYDPTKQFDSDLRTLLVDMTRVEIAFFRLLLASDRPADARFLVGSHGFPELGSWYADIRNALKESQQSKIERSKLLLGPMERIAKGEFSQARSEIAQVAPRIAIDTTFFQEVGQMQMDSKDEFNKPMENFALQDSNSGVLIYARRVPNIQIKFFEGSSLAGVPTSKSQVRTGQQGVMYSRRGTNRMDEHFLTPTPSSKTHSDQDAKKTIEYLDSLREKLTYISNEGKEYLMGLDYSGYHQTLDQMVHLISSCEQTVEGLRIYNESVLASNEDPFTSISLPNNQFISKLESLINDAPSDQIRVGLQLHIQKKMAPIIQRMKENVEPPKTPSFEEVSVLPDWIVEPGKSNWLTRFRPRRPKSKKF